MQSSIHKIYNFLDYMPRRIIHGISYPFNKSYIDQLHKTVANIDINSDEYCSAMVSYTDVFLRKKDLLCNFEDETLSKIAASDMPVIFVMNHSRQSRDPSMLMLFNALLNVKYLEFAKCATSPRPKIIMNGNIIKAQPRKMREIYEKCGAVGVDINSSNANNTASLLPVIRGYLEDKNNVFIFPEGKNCVKKYLPFEERFQDGVSKIIKKITSAGKTVKVVPLGFDYDSQTNILGSMFIGKPIYFKRTGEKILTSSSNIDSQFASEAYKKGFKGRFIREISTIKDISFQITENMKICMKEAAKRLISPDEIQFDQF